MAPCAQAIKLEIRPATVFDTEILVDLVKQLAQYEKLEHQLEISVPKLAAEMFGSRPAAEAVIAWECQDCQGKPQETAVGFAMYFTNFSTFLSRRGLFLEDLFVVPSRRGLGYGKALIQTVAKIAQQRNAGRFEWIVLDWNESAIQFYASLGAQVLPEWRIIRVTGDAIRQIAES
ncbi:GNAT family N-acetyltransferase [Parvibium lacunae]|uniref:GNAT family N-acetyltransferase n=2 Tax=Parvibium lacunae TaxID=1888893 RepID=A0A368L568_9BURK|nr:GNAT family N-acetyltransferase [Parvibium lacunae]RCS58717.1 GNAT family N-acetyltransferase [Parvibium lacunae]